MTIASGEKRPWLDPKIQVAISQDHVCVTGAPESFDSGNHFGFTDVEKAREFSREIAASADRLEDARRETKRPITPPRWALVRVPYKDETQALDSLTMQIMFDYANIRGFDQRRIRLYGLPSEVWETIPKEIMLLVQLGTNDEEPQYTPEQLLSAYKDWSAKPSAGDLPLFLDTPVPGSTAYELYKFRYEFVAKELGDMARSVRVLRQTIARLGRNPDAI